VHDGAGKLAVDEVASPAGEPVRNAAPDVTNVEHAKAQAAYIQHRSSGFDTAPPPTWGVLAAAVAMAERPQHDTLRTPPAGVPSRPQPRRRALLKYLLILTVVVSAIAGAGLVVFKTGAYKPFAKYFS
jgi:hypothetical protein